MERHQGILEINRAGLKADIDALAECIESCSECAQTCTACADACLSEPGVQSLAQCIRLNQDCADICGSAERVLSRASESSPHVIQSILQASIAVCRDCASECERHADSYEHCRVCAESCHECADACTRVLSGAAHQTV